MQNRIFFIIAGEPSGDSRAAELMRALKAEDSSIVFHGLGGPKMQAEGAKLFFDLTSISALGLWDVLKQYFQIRKIFYGALDYVNHLKPSAIILVDYPGFNLRFAKKINKRFPVFYYVSPQIWAWGGRRIHTIKRVIHHMLVLFKFEEELYQKTGVPVTWVGHPLAESAQATKTKPELRAELGISEGSKVISLLPGSREAEIKRILPEMLRSAERISQNIPKSHFLLSESSNVSRELYDSIVSPYQKNFTLTRVRGKMHELLPVSDFAIVTSGTATLETAIAGVPMVILYNAHPLTYEIGRRLVKINFLGIPNIIAGRGIIPEFIQHDMKAEKIAEQVLRIMMNEAAYSEMLANLKEVKAKLGPSGASARTAQAILLSLRATERSEAI